MNNRKPLMFVIKQLDKEWKKYLRKISQEVGMSDTYRKIIMFLSRNPGSNQKQIAEICDMTSAAISQIIKEMQLLGYVNKECDKNDQRYFKLFLTDKAKEKVDIIRDKIQIADNFVTKTISPEKEAEMVETLNILIDSVRKEI